MSEDPVRNTVDWREVGARRGLDPALLVRPSVLVAQLLTVLGERQAAESACRDLLRREPDHLSALNWLASTLRTEGRRGEAAACRRRILEIEAQACGIPADVMEEVTAFHLAAEGYGSQPTRAPRWVLVEKFDRCADEFDVRLRKDLGYRAPELVHRAATRALGTGPATLAILDAGCGTGLAAPLFRPLARRLDGVDLSHRMVEKAQKLGLYDGLEVGDLLKVLACRPDAYDLVLAVDVLVYFGDLSEVMTVTAKALRPGGLFAFSVEAGDELGYALRCTGRYVHSAGYLRQTANEAGLREGSLEEGVLRQENSKPVVGHVAVLRKGIS